MTYKAEKGFVAVAKGRFLRIPPRKARLVTDLIRGLTVREAKHLLAVTPKPSAVPAIRTLLMSAVSNVDHSQHSDADSLVIKKIYVDGGPTMKRIRPRAMGRAFSIRKRTCHIVICLSE
jgi:large subunit ribosomal protein L22